MMVDVEVKMVVVAMVIVDVMMVDIVMLVPSNYAGSGSNIGTQVAMFDVVVMQDVLVSLVVVVVVHQMNNFRALNELFCDARTAAKL